MYIPVDQPGEAWGIGLKVRLLGFVVIILIAFYFFLKRKGRSKK